MFEYENHTKTSSMLVAVEYMCYI